MEDDDHYLIMGFIKSHIESLEKITITGSLFVEKFIPHLNSNARSIRFGPGTPMYERIENLGQNWLKTRFCEEAYFLEYQDALDYCQSHNLHGYEHWFLYGRSKKYFLFISTKQN